MMFSERASNRKFRRYLPFVTCGLVTIALTYFLHQLPWQAIRHTFRAVHSRWVGIAVFLTLVNVTLRGLVLCILVRPAARVSALRSIRYAVASMTASILVPLRAGEALRAYLLMHHERIPAGAVVGVYACEKVGDLMMLSALSAPLPWLLRTLPQWAHVSLGLLAGAFALGVGSLIAMSATTWGARIRRRIAPIGTAQTLAAAALATSLAWLVDMLSAMAVLHAVGAPSSASVAVFVLVAINIAISIPAPANGGTLEFGAILALQALGIEPSKALAFAVLYHAAQVLPVLAIGLWDGPLWWQAGPTVARNSGQVRERTLDS